MAEDDTSTVWVDFNNNSPNNSIKQLSQHLPSPHVPENITQKQQLHNNSDNDNDVPPRLPHRRSPSYGIDEINEIKESFPPITPRDMPQHPKLDTYQSTDTINTSITCDRSRTSSVLESVPDHDSFPDIKVIVDTIINTEYATNPQHSQQIPPENNNNSNDSNNGNNGSNNHNNIPNNNNNNNNNNNEQNQNNNNAEKKRDNNDYRKEEHKSKSNTNATEYTYFPHKIYNNMINGNIRITKKFTGEIIPLNVKQKYIRNVYDFLYKFLAVNIHDRNVCDCGNFVILNCGFQDVSGQNLYCVANKSNQKKYSYVVRDILYTKNKIASLLPKCHRYGLLPISSKILTDDIKKIYDAFNDPHSICQNVIFKAKWHRIHIFNTPNNKQRLTFSITNNEFVDIVQKFIHNNNSKMLLPIIMFSDTYRVEYIQIVPLRKNIYIGIAYIYENNGIKVTGIHLNKNSILLQHQLVSIEHNCKCLLHFVSEIDCLHIGNPDDDKNRYNDLKKKHIILKNVNIENKQLRDQYAIINNDRFLLQCENDKLKTDYTTLNLAWQQQQNIIMQQAATINQRNATINALLSNQQQPQQAPQMNNINTTLPQIICGQNPIIQTISTATPSVVSRNSVLSINNSISYTPYTPVANITTPSSFSAVSTPQSSIGSQINMGYSQPNMNNNNSNNQNPFNINALNSINQRQVLISSSDKENTAVVNNSNNQDNQNNEKNLKKNKKQNYNDMNNDGDCANN